LSTVIFTSPYREITVLAKEIAEELDLEITLIESALDEALELVKPYIIKDPETIIVSRGATAHLLESEFPTIKLLRIESTEYDVILALHQARQYGKRVGFLGLKEEEMKLKIDHLTAMLEMDVTFYFYRNSLDFAYQVDRAKYDGIQVMIGGGMRGQMMCSERGIDHIALTLGRTTIKQALTRVHDILHTRAKEKAASELIRTVIELSHEGVAAVDDHQRVVVFNSKAAKLLKMSETEIRYTTLDRTNPTLSRLFSGSPNRLGEIHPIHGSILLVNRSPYMVNGAQKGMVVTFQDVTQIQESEQKIRRELNTKGLVAKYTFEDILHSSTTMQRLISKAKRFADVDCNVLIVGESGTGKELVAQSLHNAHPVRRNGPFVAINCAALNDHLLESELFGYEPGAFTGAIKQGKPGLFELAHGGTIFLDEIGKVSMDLQDKLLRVIQEREVRRIGGDRIIPINVRVVAAVNEDIHDLIDKEKFRQDLYYRLEVLILRIPPLRERKEDIPDLARFMMQKFARKYGKPFRPLSDEFIHELCHLNWPGNVRQLENVIERCVIIADHDDLSTVFEPSFQEQLTSKAGKINTYRENREADAQTDTETLKVAIGTMDEMQRNIVKQILHRRRYTRAELAKRLGLSRTTLWKLLQEA
jgi:transcriptional regulator with PAS, ATPase and Fis domain